ncbi:MAG: hypothetical protein ACFFD4_31070 [Candidatus Odinarchaeota archaeon]
MKQRVEMIGNQPDRSGLIIQKDNYIEKKSYKRWQLLINIIKLLKSIRELEQTSINGNLVVLVFKNELPEKQLSKLVTELEKIVEVELRIERGLKMVSLQPKVFSVD